MQSQCNAQQMLAAMRSGVMFQRFIQRDIHFARDKTHSI
jgi:hypothetical protein